LWFLSRLALHERDAYRGDQSSNADWLRTPTRGLFF